MHTVDQIFKHLVFGICYRFDCFAEKNTANISILNGYACCIGQHKALLQGLPDGNVDRHDPERSVVRVLRMIRKTRLLKADKPRRIRNR